MNNFFLICEFIYEKLTSQEMLGGGSGLSNPDEVLCVHFKYDYSGWGYNTRYCYLCSWTCANVDRCCGYIPLPFPALLVMSEVCVAYCNMNGSLFLGTCDCAEVTNYSYRNYIIQLWKCAQPVSFLNGCMPYYWSAWRAACWSGKYNCTLWKINLYKLS